MTTLWEILRGGERAPVSNLLAQLALGPQSVVALPPRVLPSQTIGGRLLHGVLGVAGLIASLFAVTLLVLWLQRDNQIFIDNTTAQTMQVTIDGQALGELRPGAFTAQNLDCGVHRVVLREPSGRTEEDTLTVPPRRDPLIGFRGIYDLSSQGQYVLLTQCYGGSCTEEDSRIVPLQPLRQGRLFALPKEVSFGLALDDEVPTQKHGSSTPNTLTLICHLRDDQSIGCTQPAAPAARN